MIKYLVAYLAIAFMMLAMDRLWLGFIAKPLQKPAIGNPFFARITISVDLLFYAVLAMGLMVFAVVPYGSAAGWRNTVVAAALFGSFAYAAYDLTNPLKNWPIRDSVRNVALGCAFSSFSAVPGKVALDWFAN
jgi:uncharacterized membrane protein